MELLLGALHDQAPSFSRVATGDNVQRGALRSLSPKVESVIQQTDMFGRFPAMWATLNGCFTIVSLIATFSVFTKQSENSASSFSPEFLNHTDVGRRIAVSPQSELLIFPRNSDARSSIMLLPAA